MPSTTILAVSDDPPSRWQRLVQRIGRRELLNLLMLLGVAAGSWGAIELADEIAEGETDAIDRRITLSLRAADDRSDPWGPGWVEEMARDATAMGGILWLGLATIGVSAWLVLGRKPRLAAFLALSVGGGLALSIWLKHLIDRPRPDLVPHGSIVHSASFPSGHSVMSAVVYLTLAALLMRAERNGGRKLLLLATAALLCLLVGISRVYLGVHWATDVLAGWTIGASWAIFCWLVGARLRREGAIEGDVSPTDAT